MKVRRPSPRTTLVMMAVVGVLLVATGAAMISLPAGLIVTGLALAGSAVLIEIPDVK